VGVGLEASAFRIVEGQYLRDILDQPRALAATLEQLRIPPELNDLTASLREGKIKRIILTGMGASFHALHPLFLRLNEHGYTALAVETSELVHSLAQWFAPETVIVAVSQSGKSAEIVRLIEENRGRAALVAITNGAESPLALRANATIITAAGKESSVSCKTYLTALMALHLLSAYLCSADAIQTREELAQLVPAVDSYLRTWKDRVLEMAAEIGSTRHFFLLGRGASLAAAGEGALILKESVRIYAEGMSGAAFRHGPLEMVSREMFAAVFAGTEETKALQAKLRDDIAHAGGKTAWIAEDASSRPWTLPKVAAGVQHVLEILPVQMMTLALAAEAGAEAGRFTHIAKITTTE